MVRLKVTNVATSPLKRGPIRGDQLATEAATYTGQLAAYREALEAQGLTVAGTWIHFPLAAGMIRMDLAPNEARLS